MTIEQLKFSSVPRVGLLMDVESAYSVNQLREQSYLFNSDRVRRRADTIEAGSDLPSSEDE